MKTVSIKTPRHAVYNKKNSMDIIKKNLYTKLLLTYYLVELNGCKVLVFHLNSEQIKQVSNICYNKTLGQYLLKLVKKVKV